MVALFRVENLRSGSIIIDGMDIANMPLEKLRSKVAIIPQDAILFAKSIRFNVDPFNWYTDECIWEALTDVNLHQVVLDLPNQLEEKVSEGGANFSAGQRQVYIIVVVQDTSNSFQVTFYTHIVIQLFCFARALLRSPKIIVLDGMHTFTYCCERPVDFTY